MIKTITYTIDPNSLPTGVLKILRAEAVRRQCSLDELIEEGLLLLSRRINGEAKAPAKGVASVSGDGAHDAGHVHAAEAMKTGRGEAA